jgi:tetratricopeptide (TPR) repeat protein
MMGRITRIACWNLLGALCIAALCIASLGCSREPARPADDLDPRAARLAERMQAAYDRGDWHAAFALADSTEEVAPRLADVPFTRGLIYTRLKRYEEARASYERALALEPAYRKAWYNLGHNAFLQRRYRQALAFYGQERALLDTADRSEQARYGEQDRQALPAVTAQIGRTYALLGVQDSARIAYEAALALDSTYAVAHAWLSDLYEDQGRLEEALHHAERALEGNPQEVEYAYQVGFLLFQMGQTREAALLLSAVVKRWPGHEGATYNLGRALKLLGREREGQALLDRVEAIQQMQEQALLAQRAVEMYPNDPQRWLDLAGLMLRSGYYDRAEEAFTAALAQRPDDLALHNDLANLALVRGDTTLAVQRFQTLLRRNPTFADAWLNLGIIYAMTGRPQEARAAWEKVLQFKPDDPDAKAYIARLP